MKKYFLLGLVIAFVASTALAQFGDILEDVVKGKVQEKTGLSAWNFQTCQITESTDHRMPASSNVAKHITYDYQNGNWKIHAKCQEGVYQLKANSYEDAKNIDQLLRDGNLKAGYYQKTFKGFFISQ
ncbi:MAG: hypothetical protein A3B70_07205 [Deltaproteobacteria bacterium RIFCSPHIGHO2_02_FULL_40_11]|nr:MAG: hypothetical protein A3B70_07205 [Deltaproteobacteria bacterium RIFCSPHIGHO2_02_FULL_40_11]